MHLSFTYPPPPLLLGGVLLFWGWQSQLLLLAIPLGLILEIARWVTWRWALSDKDFNRVADLTTIAWLLAAVYLFSQQSIQGIFTLLNWLPLIFFMLIFAQTYSQKGTIRLSAFFVSLRRLEGKGGIPLSPRIDARYPYLLMVLLASSAPKHAFFFGGALLLVVWALFPLRSRRYSLPLWVTSLLLASGVAYAMQFGLYKLQEQAEQIMLSWMEHYLWADRDPFKQRTAIGDIGKLKLSERILWRVQLEKPLNSPFHLRQASYIFYAGGTWHTRKVQFDAVSPQLGMIHRWQLQVFAPDTPLYQTYISGYTQRGHSVLPLPLGAQRLEQLMASEVEQNDLGAVKVVDAPKLIQYRAYFNPTLTQHERPPNLTDLQLPNAEKQFLQQVAQQLGLDKNKPFRALQTLRHYFATQFSYSLQLPVPPLNQSALQYFLQTHRQGHCEYFATSATLLLRAAGIPSRYVTGFLVDEYSPLEKSHIIRRRHAHAWSLVYVDGHWQTLDVTPADWVDYENERAAWWQAGYDVWAWLTYQVTRWRSQASYDRHWLGWLLIPLFILLSYRLLQRERVKRQRCTQHSGETGWVSQGSDSSFFEVINVLEQAGYSRQTGETLESWLRRIEHNLPQAALLWQSLHWHQRYRFDPQSLSSQEQYQLQQLVITWLDVWQTEGNKKTTLNLIK